MVGTEIRIFSGPVIDSFGLAFYTIKGSKLIHDFSDAIFELLSMCLDHACEFVLNVNNLFSLWPVAKDAASSTSEPEINDELEQITIARALINYRVKEKLAMANPNAPIPFPRKFQIQCPRPSSPQPPPATTSKILPLICQKTAPRTRHQVPTNDSQVPPLLRNALECRGTHSQKFPAAGAAPYVPIRQFRSPCHGIAPPVTIRTAVPVYSAPPLPQPVMPAPPVRFAPPISIRQAIPAYAAPPARKDDPPVVQKEDPPTVVAPTLPSKLSAQVGEMRSTTASNRPESETVQSFEQLKL